MALKTVTITGADDSVQPEDLLALADDFPFVEFGILLSAKQMGHNRFPSLDWLNKLNDVNHKLNLSGHLCGRWVREIVAGLLKFDDKQFPSLLFNVARIQLNFHAERMTFSEKFINMVAKVDQQIIIQMDGVNNYILNKLVHYNADAVPLFDKSHGTGVVPDSWPKPIEPYCGYAGGLNEINLDEQIQKILKIAGDVNIWIDMETGVRSNNDSQFDLDKVRKCLEIAKKYV